MPFRYRVLKTYADFLHALFMGIMQANSYVEDKLLALNETVEDGVAKVGVKADRAALRAAEAHAAAAKTRHYNALAAAHTGVAAAERRAAAIIQQARDLRESVIFDAGLGLDKINQFVEDAKAYHG